MATKPGKDAAVNALRMIPAKWAVVIIGIVIVYVVLQPRVNRWFRWNLPSVASMVGDEKPAKATPKKSDAGKISKEGHNTEGDADSPNSDSKQKDSDPLYGFLSEIGRNRYESPAGLVYGPGSEEGHRLKHIARHLEDQPDRPGSHGVFNGNMEAFLVAIDDGYMRAKKGAKGTSKKEDDDSVVYEITFEKAIGFIGGEAGGRKKNPATKKLRLVVRGNSLITAFPF